MSDIRESAINVVSEGTRIEGTVVFDRVSRVHGTLKGEVKANPGSTLILAETAVVEGGINADVLLIDGFVRGDVRARTKVVISGTGRVVGNIRTPSLTIEFGAYFEGRSLMENEPRSRSTDAAPATASPSPSPA
jgi:cytoskeletal protein CcmA (bactofilin family)